MDAKQLHPNKNLKNICYINNIIKNPNIIIGDYTYYNCERNVENFENFILSRNSNIRYCD